LTEVELQHIIKGCIKNDSSCQRKLFNYMYNYGMSVAARYGQSLHESEDIANEGFYKVLNSIQKYKPSIPFLLWVRRIIINCGIDHFRKRKNIAIPNSDATRKTTNLGEQGLNADYLLDMIRHLSPQYRLVFVLHSIDGFTHEEIARKLNISKGTSKSNLSKARKKLQKMVAIHNQEKVTYE